MLRSGGLGGIARFMHLAEFARGKKGRKVIAKEIFLQPKTALWEDEVEPLVQDEKSGWIINSIRSGLLARKVSMLHVYTEYGTRLPLTVLHVPETHVTQVKTAEKEGFWAIQIGSQNADPAKVNKPQRIHFALANTPPKVKCAEFPITSNAIIPVGTKLNAAHFVPGQTVDIRGRTVGKGFQGAMKRWGFAGGPASHGASLFHRGLGSTGSNQDPGRVFPGKKMHGHMGNKFITVKKAYVWKVDTVMNLIYVKGAVPGKKGSWVTVRDAYGAKITEPPPFPTFTVTESTPREIFKSPVDPNLDIPVEEFQKIISGAYNDDGLELAQELWASGREDDITSDDIDRVNKANLGLERNIKREKEKVTRKVKRQLERQAKRDEKLSDTFTEFLTDDELNFGEGVLNKRKK